MIFTNTFELNDGSNPIVGKFLTPIRAVMKAESDEWRKRSQITNTLFNTNKSNNFAESITGFNGYSEFEGKVEGGEPKEDEFSNGFSSTVTHFEIAKSTSITQVMMEDAKTAQMQSIGKMLVDAFYKSRDNLCLGAITNGTGTSYTRKGTTISTTTMDGVSLFNKAHKYSNKPELASKTQSNYYFGNIFGSISDGTTTYSAETFENALGKLAITMRNFKDQDGDPMGTVPNVIVIPGNRPSMEMMIKKVVGSERTAGTNYNDINLQYGNWQVIVDPNWESTDDRMILFSGEANKNCLGNLLYNRKELTVHSWLSDKSGNLNFSARARFGIGFHNWKHMLLAVGASTNANATSL